jgi:uncharacterized membrane protein YeaQ/YmgE (transglycosylase-associated protein family)
MDLMDLIWMAIFGLFVGLIARFLMPGRDSMGLIMTALLGIAGSLLGTLIGQWLLGKGSQYQAKWIMSTIGALLLLFIYRMIKKRE